MHKNRTRMTRIQQIYTDFFILICENPLNPQHRALQGKSAFYSYDG